MSKIPYFFETPIPKYFRETGWFKNPNTILFVTWAFSKCSTDARTIVYDGKEMTLAPYEFITGRGKSSNDSLLTEGAFRNQLISMQKAGLLKKTTNSTTNRYTCYVWVTGRFSNNNNQLNNQQTTNSQPTEQPQSRRENIRYKEDLLPYPSSFEKESEEEEKKEEENSIDLKKIRGKTHIYAGVSMTRAVLDECLAIKGTLEAVIASVKFIQESKFRKFPISDWPRALLTWTHTENNVSRIEEYEKIAKDLVERYPDYKSGKGYRCYVHNDEKKKRYGLMFGCHDPNVENFFISFEDNDFKEKVTRFQCEHKMSKASLK